MISAISCMALAVYFEARNQPLAGQLAVAHVIANRVASKHYPNTVCEVIRQGPTYESGHPRKHRCQFSWFCDGKSDNPKQVIAYNNMLEFARMILSGEVSFLDITDGALFYHADYVRPSWARTKKRTIEIEDHIFYRLK